MKRERPPITRFAGEHEFLSNFYHHTFMWRGEFWKTAEHAFQAMKTTDPAEQKAIRDAETPAQAKRMGRRVKLRPDWENRKLEVMAGILKHKFINRKMREKLLATGDAELIEGNNWNDRFWGQCPVGTGENWLGQLLMIQRASLGGVA